MSPQNLSDPLTYLGRYLRLKYEDRLCHLHQITYAEAAGIKTGENLVIHPSNMFINGSSIATMNQVQNYWLTDAASNGKKIFLSVAEGLQVDHRATLKKIGLPQEISQIIGAPVLFETTRIKIYGYITSISFIRSRGDKKICLALAKNEINDPVSGVYSLDYLQHLDGGEWEAYHKNSASLSGQLKLL